MGEGDNSSTVDSRSSLTGLFPYGRYGLTSRLGIWAVAGYGWGQFSLEPAGAATEYEEANTTLRMAAVGMDGLLLDGGDGGLSLTTTNVLLVRLDAVLPSLQLHGYGRCRPCRW